jgi:hypothetical protein
LTVIINYIIAAGGGIAGIISRLLALEVCLMYFLIGLFGMRQAKNNFE